MIFLFAFLALFFALNLIGDNVIVFSLLGIIAFFFILKRFNKKVLIVFLIMFAFGVGLSFFNLKLNPANGEYTGVVIETKANYYIIMVRLERIIVYESNNSKEVGDIIKLNGHLSSLVDSSLESQFSFISYLKQKGIDEQIVVSSESEVFHNFIRLKAFKNYFLNLFNADARDYVDAFLFNVKNYDNAYISMASSLNLTYLFSSSGIYLSMLFKGVEYFLFLKLDKKKTKIFSLLILSWHIVFSFNRVGIRRIIYVKILSLINEYPLKKRFSHIEVISIIAILMLLINHHLARQSGFYLGLFLSISLNFINERNKSNKKRRIFTKTSVFIILFMLPVSLSSSHELHPLTPLFQIVFLPYTFTYYLFSVISFYTYPIKPLFDFLAQGLNALVKGISYIDIAIPFKEFSNIFAFIYYLLLFTSYYFLESNSYKKVIKVTMVFSILFIVKVVPYEYLYADSITFINVGQGDSTLVRHKNKNILIDTGGLTNIDIAKEVTIPFLKKKGIYQLDYVFISHSDFDHSGALTSLKENFRVNNVITSQTSFTITIDDLEIKNLNLWADSFTDENDKSQVLLLNAANKNILMMGDASINIEQKMIEAYLLKEFNIDILKAGHHGSKTSSSYAFLKEISPEEAIISVGKNNKYGHPNKEVISNLDALNIKYRRTDVEGSISYYRNSFFSA